MALDAGVFAKNKNRYPRNDIFLIMTVEQNEVKYLAVDDVNAFKLVSDSTTALIFDGSLLAEKVLRDLDEKVNPYYIIPLGALQILTNADGGVAPKNELYINQHLKNN